MYEGEFVYQPPEEDEEARLIQLDALRASLDALQGAASVPPLDPSADLQPLMAMLRNQPAALPPPAQSQNPFSDHVTDSTFQRAMGFYLQGKRDGFIRPGDPYALQPTGDDGRPLDGPEIHFDTTRDRPTLVPSTLPPPRIPTLPEQLKRLLSPEFQPPPPPRPLIDGGPRRGDAAPVGSPAVLAALLTGARR